MFINRVSGKLDRPSRIIAVQSLVLSIINYCIRIWGTVNLTAINNVKKLQNFAAKVAKENPKNYDHATPIIQELGWLRVKEKHKLETCITVFKVLNGFYPAWYKNFPAVHEVTGSETRQQNRLYVPKTRTDAGARSKDVKGPMMWNNLPSNITDVVTLASFKNQIFKHFSRNTSGT